MVPTINVQLITHSPTSSHPSSSSLLTNPGLPSVSEGAILLSTATPLYLCIPCCTHLSHMSFWLIPVHLSDRNDTALGTISPIAQSTFDTYVMFPWSIFCKHRKQILPLLCCMNLESIPSIRTQVPCTGGPWLSCSLLYHMCMDRTWHRGVLNKYGLN